MARSFDDYLKERKQYGPPRAVNSFDDYLSIRKEEEEESQHYGVDVPNFLFDEYNSLANKYNNINNGVYISPNGAEELQNQLDFQQNIWDTYRNYYTRTGYGTEWMGDYGKNFDTLREGIGTAAERYTSYKDAGDYYRSITAPAEEEQTAFPGAPYHPNYYNQIKGTPESLDATLDSEYWKRDHEEPIEPAGAPSSNKLPLPEGTRKIARNEMYASDVRYVNPDLLKAMAGGYTPGTIPEIMLHPDLQGAGLKIPLQTPYAKSETNSPLPSPTIKWDYFRKTQKENISKYGNPKYALPYMSESELVGALEAERKAIGGKESKTTKAMDDWYSVNYIKGAEKRYDDLGRRIDEAKASLSGAVQDYTLLETQAREYAGAGELELSDQAFARSQSKLEEQYAAERALNLLEGEREFFRQRQLELRVAEKASRVLKDPSFTFDGAQYDPVKSVFEVIGMSPGARLYYTEIEGMAKSLDSDAERKQALSALAYEYINNRGAINMDIDPKGWDRMSPDEKLIFNTLHNQGNFDKALKFLEEFKEVFLFRRQAANTEEWAEYAKDQPVWAWLMSGGQYMVNALMTPFQLLSDTPYSPLFDPLVANQTIQTTQSKMAGEALSSPVLGRPLGSFLYDTLSTVRDVGASIGLGAMTGNYALTQYLMSSNAASSTYHDALLSNTDRGTAAVLAIGAGAVEWVTERFSIDVLMSKSQAKNALTYWAKNFFAEASEEGASKLANLILDNYLRGSSGEYGQMWQSIKNENPGWTDAKVTNAANAQWRQDLTAETIIGGLVGGVMAVPGATSIGIRNWNKKNSILFDDIMSQSGIQYSDVDKFSLGMGELLQGDTPTTIESVLNPTEARTEGYDRAEQATTPYTQAQRQRDIALSRLGKTTQGDVGTQLANASVLDQAATWSNEQRLAALAEQEIELEIRLAFGDKLDEAQAGLDSAQEGYAQVGESLDSIDRELVDFRQRLADLKALQNAELESPEATQEIDRAESKMAEIQTMLDRSTPTEQLPGAKAETAEPVSKRAALQTQLDTAEPVEQVPGQAPETGTADDRRTRLESQGIVAGSVEQFRQELESVDPESPDALERITEIQKRMDMAGIKRAEEAQIPYHGHNISYKRENIPDIQEHRAKNPDLNDEAFDFAAEAAYSAGLTGSRTLFEVSAAIQDLAPETAKALFDAGLGAYNAQEGERRALKARLKDYMPKPGKGKLIIPKDVIQKMNPEQKKLAGDLQRFIIMAGVEGELFVSETADESGRILDEEGSFDPATGRFTFDINAGINFIGQLANKSRGAVEFALPRVMGHEFTHYLKATAPELYTVFQEAVIKELSAKNQLDDLILTELGRARKGALSIGVALEEVVARSSEMMFRDSQALARAMGENPTLWQKFKAWVTEFVQNIKDRMKGMNPAYAGAKSLIETGDGITQYVGDLQAKWDKALEQSITDRMDAPGLLKTAPISPVVEWEGVTLSPQEMGAEGAGIAGNEDGEQERFSERDGLQVNEDGTVVITNADAISMDDWKKIAKNVIRLGYDIKGPSDAKRIYSRPGIIKLNPDISEVIKQALGVAVEQAQAINPQVVEAHRTAAIKEFGYTPYFYDAGYILPNGKLLNFSGEKGKHYGSRGQDHRAIGVIFDEEFESHSGGMIAFMNEGNIRIMDETPGVDLAADIEPTAQQLKTIREHIKASIPRQYYAVDFSSKDGYSLGGYEYENGANPTRVMADIDYFYKNGEVREQSEASRFYSERDSTGTPLSPQQVEFFKDSKVRDEQGRLLKVYHGTPYGGFTIFRDESYFTGNKEYADIYQNPSASSVRGRYDAADNPMTYEVYLNITRPFDTRNATEKRIFTNQFYRKYGNGTPLSERGLPDWTDSTDLIEFIQENGLDYDGIILDEGGTGGYGEEVKPRGLSYVPLEPEQIKSADPVTYDDAGNVIPLSQRFDTGKTDIRYSVRVTDPATLDFLNNQETVTVYRAMQVIDGKYYPPMAAKIKSDNGKKALVSPTEIGAWEQSVERPELIRDGGKFELDKANGSAIQARYNPYFHTSKSPLNDQFSSAYKRDNLVVVEGEVPSSELTSGYRAQYAKDAVGETKWHSGPVSSKLRGEKARSVILSRWFKPNRIVPDAEVASKIASILDGEDIAIPYKVVTRKLADELEKQGVSIRYSVRDPENSLPSARAILGGAFGEVAQTDAEKKRVAEYRKSADLYNRLENELNNLLDRRKQLYRDKAPQSEKNELRADINALRDKLDKADRVLLNLQMSKPLRDVVAREVDKEYQRQKAKSQERQKEYREKVTQRDSRSKFIKSIEGELNDLRKRLLTPDKKHYVPESLRKTINDLLQASDMAWTKADGTEVTSRRSKSWQEAMGNLMTQMQNADAFVINHGEIASPDFVMDIDPDLAPDIQNLIRQYDTVVRYRDMDLEGLAAFDSIVKRVRHAVTGANNLHDLEVKAAVSDVAEGTLSDQQEKKDKKLHGPGIERLASFLNLDMADAFSFFERLGPRSRIILDSLYKRGFGKLVRNTEQAREFFQNLDKKYKDFGIANWSGKNAQVHTFDIQGGTVHLTTGQVMELYLLNKREQARGHIYGKGLSIEQIKSRKAGKAAKLWQKNPVRVIENDVNTILGVLTNEQRAAADEIAGFLNTVSSQWGNEVSMTLYGYLKFVDPNYYPIHSDTNFTLAQDPSKNEMINALLNLGSTKNVIKGANNPVIISDIFDTVTRHITDMANYNAFAVPLSNAMKWFNYKRESVDEKGNPRMASVRGSIERTMGKDANRYFINLLKSVNGIKGTSVSTGFIGIINSAVGKFKTAAVAGNIRVVLQQHASYARAASMINPAFMAAAYAKSPKRGMQMARKYSPIAMWKHLGYYDMQIGREMTDLISGRDNPLRKVQEVTLKPAGLADDFTLGVLWNAIEIELGQTYEGDKRTEEFYKLVGDRLTDVIDRTQVVDTVFHRPQIMRDRDSLVKISTSFMAEPIKGYNMLVNAARSGDVGRIARTGVTFVATSILVAMAAGLSDALRDKEKEKGEEGFWDSYWSKVAGINGNFFESNIFDNINPLNMIPLGKDIWGIAGGYTPSRPDLQAVQRLIKAGQGWLKVFDGTAGQVSAKLITNTISALSTATGIPASNIYRDVMSVIDTLNPRIIVGEGGVPAKLMYERYASALLAGDEDKALEYYNALIEAGTKLTTVHTGIRAAIKANLEAGKINRETYIQQMIDATDYDDVKNDFIKQWFATGEIDEAEAKRLLQKFTADDEATEQFRTLESWKHVPENDEDSYRVLNKFLEAVRTGKNLRAVVTDYTDPNKYAYDSKYLAGRITDAFKQEYIDNPAQRSRLKGYLLNAYTLLGYDRKERSGEIDRWLMKYDSADFENAIATGVNLKAVIDEKIKYSTAKNPKGVIISQVTATFADQYKKMTPTERSKIKPRLIDAYVMLGYDRAYSSKKIDKWLTD